MVVQRTLTAFFQDEQWNKIAGLSGVSVTIFDVTDWARVQVWVYSMTEMSTGLYAYTFVSFDTQKEYIFMFDGGNSLSNILRYKITGANAQENIEDPLQEIKNFILDIANTENIITQPL